MNAAWASLFGGDPATFSSFMRSLHSGDPPCSRSSAWSKYTCRMSCLQASLRGAVPPHGSAPRAQPRGRVGTSHRSQTCGRTPFTARRSSVPHATLFHAESFPSLTHRRIAYAEQPARTAASLAPSQASPAIATVAVRDRQNHQLPGDPISRRHIHEVRPSNEIRHRRVELFAP